MESLFVDAETFAIWLDSAEFSYGVAVQRWWADLRCAEEGSVGGVKEDEDETTVDFFARVRDEVEQEAKEAGVGVMAVVREGAVSLQALFDWLQQRLGSGFGMDGGEVSREVVMDEVLHELTIASWFKDGGGE